MISARFYLYPSTFKGSFVHPTESLFIPAAIISFGTILINITQYGVTGGSARPWLECVMTVMYWFYCVLAIVFSCVIYLIMYVSHLQILNSFPHQHHFPPSVIIIILPRPIALRSSKLTSIT